EAVLNQLQNEDDKKWDLGWVFTVIAGVLNIMVIYDALAGPAFATAASESRASEGRHGNAAVSANPLVTRYAARYRSLLLASADPDRRNQPGVQRHALRWLETHCARSRPLGPPSNRLPICHSGGPVRGRDVPLRLVSGER